MDIAMFAPAIKKMADHLAAQRQRSTRMGCAYRGNADARCPVGALIADEVYSARAEGASIRRLDGRATPTSIEHIPELVPVMASILDHFPGADHDFVIKFLEDVQTYHDRVTPFSYSGETYAGDMTSFHGKPDEQFSRHIEERFTEIVSWRLANVR